MPTESRLPELPFDNKVLAQFDTLAGINCQSCNGSSPDWRLADQNRTGPEEVPVPTVSAGVK